MRGWLIGIAALMIPAVADAQILANGLPIPDPSLATKADVPVMCSGTPAADSFGGGVGTGTPCIRRSDASAPTTVQPANALTAADGSFSGIWPAAFATAPMTAVATAKTAAEPYTCQVAVATTTTFSGKCWRAIPATLPGVTTALVGAVVATYQNAAAGLTVMVVGRQ